MSTGASTWAWLFPGQGSQFVGMGKEVREHSKAAAAIFARADEALGEPFSRLIFEGPEAELTLTANAQPAIVTMSMAMLAALRERVPNLELPLVAAGHSLGEYSALVAAGALRFEDAVRLVRARGQAMQDAVPAGVGAMAAVMGMSEADLTAVCNEVREADTLSLANFNAPGQIVIAGTAAAVQRASGLASERGGKAIALKVSAPFHCALMAHAADVVARELAGIEISAGAFPVVANVDAEPNVDPARTKLLLVAQVAGAVRWEQSVRKLKATGAARALEIGPGKVLAGLAKRIDKELTMTAVSDMATLDIAAELLLSGPARS
jgi:[acyl-carrier-protein] S-malonyltransferase